MQEEVHSDASELLVDLLKVHIHLDFSYTSGKEGISSCSLAG